MTDLAALDALDGLISAEVGRGLYELAGEVPRNQAIVELGSFKGKSTCYLAAGARAGCGAHVHAVDAWNLPGNIGGRHQYDLPARRGEFDAQLSSAGLSDQITTHRAFSQEAARAWHGPLVGLLYIDASHEYADVRDDFAAWSVHIPVGGCVAFDDYDTLRNPGVRRFVDELRGNPSWTGWEFEPPPLAICRRAA